MKKRKIIYALLFLFLIVFLVYSRWISFNVFSRGDWGFFYNETALEFLNLTTWKTSLALGSVDLLLWRGPFEFLYGLIGFLGFDKNVSEKFVVFWPTILIANVTSFFLVRKIAKSNIGGFIGVIVFNYSTYYLGTTHLLLYSAGAFGVASLLFFIKSVEEKKIRFSLLTSISLFITASYDFRVFYIMVIVIFFYFLYYLFITKDRGEKVQSIIIYSAIPVVICSVISIYWLLPFFFMRSLSSNAIIDRDLFGNEFLNINYAFTLHHPFWTGSAVKVFEVQPISISFWTIPFIAFLGLLLNRKNRYIVFFGIISLLGIFFTKQVSQPFSNVYPFLFENFPGFNAFREASKFYFLIAVGYAVLIAGFVGWLWKNWTQKKWQVYGKYFVTILITALFLWNTKPLITGEIGTLFVPREIPKDYLIVKDFILKQPEYFRTLWIPTFSRWSIYTNSHPEVSTVNAINAEWDSFIENDRNEDITEAELMTKILSKEDTNKLLDMSSIKYVFIPLKDTANDDDFFKYYGKDRGYYIRELDKLEYLNKIDIGTKEIVVYENKDFRPHIYVTESKEQLSGSREQETVSEGEAFRTVKYEFINPTEYRVQLTQVKEPFYLHFSESFHPDWKIRIGDFRWWDVITKKDYFLSDKNHFENDAKLNSFYIDPIEVCKVNSCKKNSDGSYDIDMILYFKPQSYMYLGGIVSISTLVGILGYFGYLGIKKVSSKQRARNSEQRIRNKEKNEEK